ncbi:tetratricopeptide repeat protein [Qipengyuania aquimaris]|uniref:tetratricopeptide repeat protein n=1 Tax=Qipengyuania aquimaris TaxID=255984 RepID=UPI001CD6F39A|nr:tetratricopeptide repeat protein [Qipengyuania aquimaris]MCA0904443.1 tetratricopeptide repeat protein [Qipengyuania aquimaris]
MTFRRSFPVHLALGLAAASAMLVSCADEATPANDLQQLRTQIARGDAGAAELTIDRLVENKVDRGSFSAFAGEAALLRGDLVEACKWLAEGNFDSETAPLGFRMLAELELREGDLDASARALAKAREIAPDDPRVWVDIGRLRYRLGNHRTAIEAAERAVEFGPDDVEALRFRGQLVRDIEGMIPAAKWFAAASEKSGGDTALELEYAASLLDAGRFEQAQTILSRTDDPYLMAIALARTSDFFAAREALERAETNDRQTAAARLLSAIIDVELGNLESAAQNLDQLAREQPANRRVRDLLAYVLSRNGNEDELIYRFADQARGPQGSPWLRILVGRAYETQDNREEAAEFLDLAASDQSALSLIDGDDARAAGKGAFARRNSIRAALSAGSVDRAVQEARHFSEEYPQSVDAASLLGDALLMRSDLVGARKAYQRAAQMRGSWPLLLRMAATLDRSEAARLVAEYAAANPLNAEAAAMAADGYAAAGQWREAAASLDRALENGMRDVPWVLAARSVAARELGEGNGVDQLDWAIEAYETQRMSQPAIAALLAALPEEDVQLRSELAAKLQALAGN